MAFDQPTRNRLARFVGDARALLSEEFTRQLQLDYGLDPEIGAVATLEALTHLDDSRRETARILHTTLAHYLAGQAAPTGKAQADAARREVLGRIVREQAYTVLNRLCALRMAEARGLLVESIARGYQSKGFQLYARLAGTALGETGDAYRSYLFSLFDEFAVDLAVLFDRFSPQGRLFPREAALLRLLDALNHAEIAPLWAEDETLGWIYQYFNSDEERRQMRAESQAPRNSRELAVRNQFFTPRYVVEFLTDNTLGRLWYEMTQGQTALAENCHYLVRRPQEIFLAEGETAPVIPEPEEELSQEALLQQPVYIPYRARKDPREIRMLDPACGSMHFGLYAFDLFERIYEEAWDWEASEGALGRPHRPGPLDRRLPTADHRPLTADYPDKAALLRDVPRLIIEHNIHGIDIDPRAAQIAGLSLWLRAQRSWQAQGLKPQERPQIRRSNVVCAEPMPGDKALLAEFTATLPYKVLGQLVERIFDKMALAGEAGSLLKIEEELTEAVEQARQAYNASRLQEKQAAGYLPGLELARAATLFDFVDLPADAAGFWDEAEARVLAALEAYAEQAQNGGGFQRRLFAQDAARGFAFIDVCRKRYDVVLMNPPFGEASESVSQITDTRYPTWNRNLLCAFVDCSIQYLEDNGLVGSVFDKTAATKTTYEGFRRDILLKKGSLQTQLNLGWGVLDANVEVAALIAAAGFAQSPEVFFNISDLPLSEKAAVLQESVTGLSCGKKSVYAFYCRPEFLTGLPNAVIAFDFPLWLQRVFARAPSLSDSGFCAFVGHSFKSERHFRLLWEIDPDEPVVFNEGKWSWLFNGGDYSPFYNAERDIVAYGRDGDLVASDRSVTFRSIPLHGKAGIGYGKRGDFIDAQILSSGHVFTVEGEGAIIASESDRFFFSALLSSNVFSYGINLYCGQHKYPGYVNIFPCPSSGSADKDRIVKQAKKVWEIKRDWQSGDETDTAFLVPNLLQVTSFSSMVDRIAFLITKESDANAIIADATKLIDEHFEAIYRVPSEAASLLQQIAFRRPKNRVWNDAPSNSQEKSFRFASDLVSYAIGCKLGRWDIRCLGQTQEQLHADCLSTPPRRYAFGALLDQGSPSFNDPIDYPLTVAWNGILVDDESSSSDIEAAIRQVFGVAFGDLADQTEHEISEILRAGSLREFLRKYFFDFHLQRYTHSRRAAPIYWPLSTPSGSYTLWIYYHRLTDQTLYTCVNDFVDPKLQALARQLNGLRGKSRRSNNDERELERLSTLEVDLQGFREELLRLAAFWKPNLNDGVQITAAPLWRLFQHRGWQQQLRETWENLEAGEYDWAHLALSLWPERVIPACTRNRSFAIAHEVEELFWVEDEGKWRALDEPEAEIATQKQCLLQCNRESTRAQLEALAEGPAQGVPAYQVCQHLTEGAWDDLPIARHFWPERAAEKLWDEPQLALQAGMFLPDKRTQAARKRFLKEQLSSGAPELAEAFVAAFQDVEAPFEQAWAALARGAHDAQPLALALWPKRVLEKCLYDVELAAAHDLRRFFWVQGADGEWRRRKKLRQEIQEEVDRRRK